MILVIDNYDSFVCNLARYVREAGWKAEIIRNDAATAAECFALAPAGVIISPGPKRPADSGVSMDVIAGLDPRIPLLGVCLGHQCLVEAFGGATVRARHPLHGEASEIRHDGRGVFAGVPSPMLAGRYHSLVAAPQEGNPMRPCATSADGELMGVRHDARPWFGVQFHPESLLTPNGRRIIHNFLAYCRKPQ